MATGHDDDDDDDDDDDADDAHADDDDHHLRVACYPRAPLSHVTLGRACHMVSRAKQSKGKKRKARKANEAKQKRSKSNCDARHVTCYPRAGVSHVTLGRACHMLPLGRPLFWLRVEPG